MKIVEHNMSHGSYMQAYTYLCYVEALVGVWRDLPIVTELHIEGDNEILLNISELKQNCLGNLEKPRIPARNSIVHSGSFSSSPPFTSPLSENLELMTNSITTSVDVHGNNTGRNDLETNDGTEGQPTPKKRPNSFVPQEIIHEVNEEAEKNSPSSSIVHETVVNKEILIDGSSEETQLEIQLINEEIKETLDLNSQIRNEIQHINGITSAPNSPGIKVIFQLQNEEEEDNESSDL